MSIKSFPRYMYEIYAKESSINLGKSKLPETGELVSTRLMLIFYRTDLFTNQQVRLRSIASFDLYESAWITPATDIEGFTDSNYWMGFVNFSYPSGLGYKNNVQLTHTLETTGYTHSHTGTQIGAIVNYIDQNDSFNGFDVIHDTAAYMSHIIRR